MNNLHEKDLFINENNPFLFNTDITEYDMKDGGFSLIREFNLLSEKEIKRLENLDKERRTISIGLMQKENSDLVYGLKESFKIARKLFFEANEIEKSDIISIKKDAIFTTKKCKSQKFGKYINFRPKNVYSSYIYLGKKLELYYSANNLDIKGISDEAYKKHSEYMVNFIKSFINKMETENSGTVIEYTKRFIDKYKWRELNIGYYRELNANSMYKLLEGGFIDTYFDSMKDEVDISYNFYNILLKLIKIPL